jgi:hypothetical protein
MPPKSMRPWYSSQQKEPGTWPGSHIDLICLGSAVSAAAAARLLAAATGIATAAGALSAATAARVTATRLLLTTTTTARVTAARLLLTTTTAATRLLATTTTLVLCFVPFAVVVLVRHRNGSFQIEGAA